jgi:hypothetical protein
VRLDETIDAIGSYYAQDWTDGLPVRHHGYWQLRSVRIVQSARRRGTGSAWCPNGNAVHGAMHGFGGGARTRRTHARVVAVQHPWPRWRPRRYCSVPRPWCNVE